MIKEEQIKEKWERIIDANANRAREGIRVIEEVARFILEDPSLTTKLKEIRHRITEYIREIDPDKELIFNRDSNSDIGAKISLKSEKNRLNLYQIVEANFKRTEEAIRVLEEFLKIFPEKQSNKFKDLRFEIYGIEKEVCKMIK